MPQAELLLPSTVRRGNCSACILRILTSTGRLCYQMCWRLTISPSEAAGQRGANVTAAKIDAFLNKTTIDEADVLNLTGVTRPLLLKISSIDFPDLVNITGLSIRSGAIYQA
jgi:hypothetical protein